MIQRPNDYRFIITDVGHSCADIWGQEGDPEYEDIKPGETSVTEEPIKRNIDDRIVHLGGSVPNGGITEQRQLEPGRVAAVTLVGRDNIADRIRGGLQQEGINIEGVVENPFSHESSATIVRVFPNDRGFSHYEGPNRQFSLENLPGDIVENIVENIIKQSFAVHHGYPNLHHELWKDGGKGFFNLVSMLHDIGVTISLDFTCTPDLAPMTYVIYSLEKTDIFVPNCDEAMKIAMPIRYANLKRDIEREFGKDAKVEDYVTVDDLREMTQFFLDLGIKISTIKLGGKGLYMRTASKEKLMNMGRMSFDDQTAELWANVEYWSPSFNVDVVDPTAAGDAAYATILVGIYKGYDPVTTLTLANYIGACCVGAPGLDNVPVMRDGRAQLGRISFDVNPIDPGSNWTYNPDKRVYVPTSQRTI